MTCRPDELRRASDGATSERRTAANEKRTSRRTSTAKAERARGAHGQQAVTMQRICHRTPKQTAHDGDDDGRAATATGVTSGGTASNNRPGARARMRATAGQRQRKARGGSMPRRHRAAKRKLQRPNIRKRNVYTDDGSRSVGSRRYSSGLAKPPTHGKPEEYRKRERLSYFQENTEDITMPADPAGSGRQWVGHWYRRGRNTARVCDPTQCSSVGTSRVCVLPMILSVTYTHAAKRNAYRAVRTRVPCRTAPSGTGLRTPGPPAVRGASEHPRRITRRGRTRAAGEPATGRLRPERAERANGASGTRAASG